MRYLAINQPMTVANERSPRRGMAVTELAVCLPILVLIVFATIETCSMIYLKQTLAITAYEGARIGVVPKASDVNVDYQCSVLLDARNVKGYTITMNPPNPATLSSGDFFEVTIAAAYSANSLLGGWFFNDRTVTKSCALRTN